MAVQSHWPSIHWPSIMDKVSVAVPGDSTFRVSLVCSRLKFQTNVFVISCPEGQNTERDLQDCVLVFSLLKKLQCFPMAKSTKSNVFPSWPDPTLPYKINTCPPPPPFKKKLNIKEKNK